jgi:voltage-gated potassium channel
VAESAIEREVRLLYTGRSQRAVRFRYGLIAFDFATILYFIATMPFSPTPAMAALNVALGVLILIDFGLRLWIAENRLKTLLQVYTLADAVVAASLLVLPFFATELAFLRVLRGLRLIHSYHLLRDLRRDSRWFRRNEEAVLALINLVVFLFVIASLVFVLFFGRETGFAGYVDALYFTVATLTTTGYGDITPNDPTGKLLSVFVMIVGVALFVRLATAVFRPPKVRHRCGTCGLSRHDEDAVHCKHCGSPLKIETEGAV